MAFGGRLGYLSASVLPRMAATSVCFAAAVPVLNRQGYWSTLKNNALYRFYKPVLHCCASRTNQQRTSINLLNTNPIRSIEEADGNRMPDTITQANDNDLFLPVWKGNVLVTLTKNSDSVRAVMWDKARTASWLQSTTGDAASSSLIAPLSMDAERRYYAIDVSQHESPMLLPDENFVALRGVLSKFDEKEANLTSHAKVLLSWHKENTYCGRCASRTVLAKEGRARTCPKCNSGNLYPRVEPSVLVLVLRNDGEECLLARKAFWPQGRYSVIAGFCEVFESLEEAAAREVLEETGVVLQAGTVKYKSSQPWPSPRNSLMSAYTAYAADGGPLKVDHSEIEDARWFGREWLRRELTKPVVESSVSIPGKASLSHRLITDWLNEGGHSREAAPCGC